MSKYEGQLYDCVITYHLLNGQVINESFRQDIPEELWKSLLDEFNKCSEALELNPSDSYAKALLPKSNISYITMKCS